RVRPDGAQAVGARARRRTGRDVDARTVVAAGHVEHLLVRLPAPVDPSLDDLDALERRARLAVAARVLQREDGEAGRAGVAELAAHRDAVPVAALDEV